MSPHFWISGVDSTHQRRYGGSPVREVVGTSVRRAWSQTQGDNSGPSSWWLHGQHTLLKSKAYFLLTAGVTVPFAWAGGRLGLQVLEHTIYNTRFPVHGLAEPHAGNQLVDLCTTAGQKWREGAATDGREELVGVGGRARRMKRMEASPLRYTCIPVPLHPEAAHLHRCFPPISPEAQRGA